MTEFRKRVLARNKEIKLTIKQEEDFEKLFKINERGTPFTVEARGKAELKTRDRILLSMNAGSELKNKYYLWHLAKYINEDLSLPYKMIGLNVYKSKVSEIDDEYLVSRYGASEEIRDLYNKYKK